MIIHIMVFIYNFSVFSGLCCIALLMLLHHEDKNTYFSNLIPFVMTLFVYGFVNLLLYYQLHVVKFYSVELIFSLTVNITFILIFYQWFRFVDSVFTEEKLNLKKWTVIYRIICIFCAIVWTTDSLFFMDNFYNIQVKWGNYFSTFCEAALFFFTLIINLRYILIALKEREKTDGSNFMIIQSMLNLVYFGYILFKDIMISFFSYNTQMWSSHWVSVGSLYYLATYAAGIFFIVLRLDSIIKKRKQILNEESIFTISAEELASRYNLTKREREVFELIYKGFDNQYISEHLFISGNTLKKHINSIFKKMNIKSRLEIMNKIRYIE